MTYKRRRSEPSAVREPVQVYLDPADQRRLARITEQLATSKSDALRRGLEALERQLTDPEAHPALRIIGMVSGTDVLDATGDRAAVSPEDLDPARDHDEALARGEEDSWSRRSDA